ncbi:nuclear transport factor 2 family protein [uncultured Roseobacter sp.]|uniref:YybH family protein n=1 Tax=uncultured Roseobacter sp. TaxID=114847 RepID=UPI002635E040|nr:nuclear transport factor 2 family protein [uncultured Roseobacter sp.]
MRLLSSLSGFAFAALMSLPAAATEPLDLQQEFTAYNERYNEIIATYDLEAFIDLYDDAPLWIAPDKEPVAGLDVPRGTFGFIIENEGRLTHSFDELIVSDDGTQAVMIGRYEADIEKVGVKAQGTYLFVLERDGEAWNIVVDMFNQHAADGGS